MELSEDNLRTLAGYLQHTLSPDMEIRKPAEKFLESVECNQGYPILLLNLLDNPDVDSTIRVAGAVAFKNYVKRNWRVDEDDGDKISQSDRQSVKDLIINLMLKSPDQIQKQLSDAISIIGREDFPDKWRDLLDHMVVKFDGGDFHVINGVLHTAHSLFKHYRYELKSQKLWTEIKFVLDNFAKPLTSLLNNTMDLAATHANNPDALKVIFSSLTIIAKIFYSLNFQDLPEFFEDSMETWMKHFLTLLKADNKLLRTEEDEEAGLLEQLKSQICDNISIYAQKYDEEFRSYLPSFVNVVWELLVSLGPQAKYDSLVSNAIKFLASVAERQHYKQLFADSNALSSICEKVLLPNMEFRVSDEELFEDNAEEYIRRDIEGSDVDTRRRAACDLVKALSKHFEGEITQIFSRYVATILESYKKNPKQSWKHKNMVVYLVTALAVKAQTAKHGTTQTNELVNLADFYQSYIYSDICDQNVTELPVLKADAVRYVMTFRNQLPREILLKSFPHLVHLLTAPSQVVHSYAAVAIEKLLLLRLPDGTASFKSADIQPMAEALLHNLFQALSHQCSTENEYVMKAIMRTFSTLQAAAIPYMGTLFPRITAILTHVSKNPSKPHFNHYLFEAVSLSIRIVCKENPTAVSSFEEALFPIIQEILLQDIPEFLPYVFQIMSLLLELHDSSVPEPYMILFPHLVSPALWERAGNIHPLVRLLQAYVERGSREIIGCDKLNGLLGVYQKLIASKLHDNEGFYLITSIIESMPREALAPVISQVFLLLFQRLQSSKTTKFIKCLLVFFSLYAGKNGGNALAEIVDGIQLNMFGMVLEKLYISEVQKVSGQLERKICGIGITKILCEVPSLWNGNYSHLWTRLLEALINLFELPEDDTIPEDEHFIDVEDTPGYQTAYSQLAFAGKKETDPFASISNHRVYLIESLTNMSANFPGKMEPMIRSHLTQRALNYLEIYLLETNRSFK